MEKKVGRIQSENTIAIANTAASLGIAITIENLANSLMWKTSSFLSG